MKNPGVRTETFGKSLNYRREIGGGGRINGFGGGGYSGGGGSDSGGINF